MTCTSVCVRVDRLVSLKCIQISYNATVLSPFIYYHTVNLSSHTIQVDLIFLYIIYVTQLKLAFFDHVTGSRPGAVIASCWSAMMYFGESGYVETTKKIITTTRYIAEQ